MTVMPFGKHRNTPIDQVPVKYLRWVLREIRTLSPDLRADITAVLSGRPQPKSDYEKIDDLFNSKYGGQT
jgi:hypothetical protein